MKGHLDDIGERETAHDPSPKVGPHPLHESERVRLICTSLSHLTLADPISLTTGTPLRDRRSINQDKRVEGGLVLMGLWDICTINRFRRSPPPWCESDLPVNLPRAYSFVSISRIRSPLASHQV
jgi:hypothetical protein